MTSFSPAMPIAIIGAGTIGAKVASACARSGLATRLFDLMPGRAQDVCDRLALHDVGAARHLSAVATLGEAVADAGLAFENVPENMDLKTEVLRALDRAAPSQAYLGSNTSSLLCTPLAMASGRPDRFFTMNFSDPETSRIVELMGCTATAPATIAFAKDWAHALGLVVLHVRKEQRGYSRNRLWRVIKREVLRQIAEGIVTAEEIDRAWMIGYGAPKGPCARMDAVGLGTVLAIEQAYFEESGDPADRPPVFLEAMVAAGKLGVATGEGFYTYPGPTFEQPGFLDPGQ